MSTPLLLDIDLDYLYRPRQGNTWHPWSHQRLWMTVDDLLQGLRAKGLRWDGAPVAALIDHAPAYWFWSLPFGPKRRPIRGATCIHVDAHSDWYRVAPHEIHCGNFLRKALQAGMVSDVWWVTPEWLDWHSAALTEFLADEIGGEGGAWVEGQALCMRIGKGTARVVTLAGLPAVNRAVDLVTLAGSPGYAPDHAEGTWRDLLTAFGRRPDRNVADWREELTPWDILRRLEAPVSSDELSLMMRARLRAAAKRFLASGEVEVVASV